MINFRLDEHTVSDPIVTMCCRRILGLTGIGKTLLAVTFFCLAMPTTTAHAQTSPSATGLVTCNVTYQGDPANDPLAGTTKVIENSITLASLGGLFTDRWGTGRNVTYASSGTSGLSGAGDRSFSVYLFSTPTPNDSAGFEQEYSETGKLDYKVGKANTFTITGTSFVSMDYNWGVGTSGYLHLVGQCTWKLNGTGTLF